MFLFELTSILGLWMQSADRPCILAPWPEAAACYFQQAIPSPSGVGTRFHGLQKLVPDSMGMCVCAHAHPWWVGTSNWSWGSEWTQDACEGGIFMSDPMCGSSRHAARIRFPAPTGCSALVSAEAPWGGFKREPLAGKAWTCHPLHLDLLSRMCLPKVAQRVQPFIHSDSSVISS